MIRMKLSVLQVCFFWLILHAGTGWSSERIYLFAAASMTDSIKETVSHFSKLHPEVKVLTNFGSSGALAKQIVQGAPADIYISANPKWVEYLVQEKEVRLENKKVVATNRLVFVGKKDLFLQEFKDIVSLQRIAIGTPQSVPAGQYAKQAMVSVGIYDDLLQSRKLVMAKDVRQALLYADRGEVDGAFVYASDAMLARRAKLLFTVPEALSPEILYFTALTDDGKKKSGVRLLYEYLDTEKVAAVLKRYGFVVAQDKKQQ